MSGYMMCLGIFVINDDCHLALAEIDKFGCLFGDDDGGEGELEEEGGG